MATTKVQFVKIN
jgi:hypothetical protein